MLKAKLWGGRGFINSKSAFTLIEFLAIIVILAILAVVTIPTILNVVDNSKQGSVIDAFYGYKEAVNQYYVESLLDNSNKSLNGSYIVDNGYLSGVKIPVSGSVPKSGYLTYNSGKLISGVLQFDEYVVTFDGDEVKSEKIDSPITIEDGLYVLDVSGRYIYKGSNPDNYIWLDENGDEVKQDSEMYRIISYENDGTIKVIRNESIGSIAWDVNEDNSSYTLPWATDTSVSLKKRPYNADTVNPFCNTEYGCNVWGNLNTTYLGDNILSTVMEEYKYKYYQDNKPETLLQDYSNNGVVDEEASLNILLNNYWYSNLSDGLKDSIVNHSYNVGGLFYYNGYNGGDKGIEREKNEISTYTWNGKIALMDITDMVDTSINFGCTSVYSNYYYSDDHYDYENNTLKDSNWPCTNNNWLFNKSITEWSLSANSHGRGYVWYVSPAGYFSNSGVYHSYLVRPAFYLKSSMKLVGEGTIDNPYQM